MAANPEDIRPPRELPAMQDAVEALKNVVGTLEREAEDRVARRNEIEERWLEDLEQYHGKYDASITADLKAAKKSQLFINLTRAKTNAMEARLSDMLFPTDDKNWGIGPTPVPDLTVQAEQAANMAAQESLALAANKDDPQLQQSAAAAQQNLAVIQKQLDEAKTRAGAMETEIEDVLIECRYPIQCRDVIRDGCRIGIGVLKGPVSNPRPKRSWQKSQANVYEIVYSDDKRPAVWRVDPWNFFPDMDACSMDENEKVFERHLLNEKQLRSLAKRGGFNKDAVRRLLAQGPVKGMPSYLSKLRTITGSQQDPLKDRYIAWEYSGPLTATEMVNLATALGREDMLDDAVPEDIDPLAELNVILWFCQGELLKFGIYPLDSNDPLYSVFNLEKDETTLFGYGIPYIMRDPQKALAAAWRTLLDNMGLASGPQIVYNDEVVEPVNGENVLEPRKVWRRKSNAPKDMAPFETYDIPSHAQDLMAIIDLCRRNIDEETAMPMIAQGEQGAQVTKTAQGMGILMNSVNVVFRRIVKNWDDDVTTPTMTRMYDWEMQFSPKEHIKGDYQVDARGSSVLLVREMQSANLMWLVANATGHPIIGKWLKEEGLPQFRRLVQTMLIPSDEIIKSDVELKADAARDAGKPPPPDPEMEKLATQMNLEQMRGESEKEIALIKRETELIKLAGMSNMKLDELKARLYDSDQNRQSKERIFAAEAAVEARQAKQQKKNGKQKGGSGGYIS